MLVVQVLIQVHVMQFYSSVTDNSNMSRHFTLICKNGRNKMQPNIVYLHASDKKLYTSRM